MNETTRQGISALRSGDRAAARALLTQAIEQDPDDANAWLWLTGAIEADDERIECLKQVLRIDPNNQAAMRGLSQLIAKQPELRNVAVVSAEAPETPQEAVVVEVPKEIEPAEAIQSAEDVEIEIETPLEDSQAATKEPHGAWIYEIPAREENSIEEGVLSEIAVEEQSIALPEIEMVHDDDMLTAVPAAAAIEIPEELPTDPAAITAGRKRKQTAASVPQTIFRTRPSIVPALVGFWVFLIGTVAVGILLRDSSILALGLSVGIGLILILIVAYALIRNIAVRYELTDQYLTTRFRGKRVRVPIQDITQANCRQTFFQRILGTGDVLIKATVNNELANLRLRNIPECRRRVTIIQETVQKGSGIDIRS